MNRSLTQSVRGIRLTWVVLAVCHLCCGRTNAQSLIRSISGTVCDVQHRPVAGAAVNLESAELARPISVTTDVEGHFKFPELKPGRYTLRVTQRGFADIVVGPFDLNERQGEAFLLLLKAAPEQPSSRDAASDMPFSDETHFTVAGVTDTTSLGGHGSDPVRRNSDALSRDTAKLNNAASVVSDEARIRERLSVEDKADLRFELAEIEEKSGRSLEAVKDYQRAAEMDPSEAHVFAWGAELLLHRAVDPSIEVFTKGRRLYPNSVRMTLGLGSAIYARGSSDEAKRTLIEACDIAPSDQTPYLFLGKLQATESTLPDGWTERLKRFADLYPGNALAHYFYAVALTKKSADRQAEALAESQLKTAVRLDPQLGDAYLELGIIASERGGFPDAIPYLQQAVANTPLPDDAHYRLAQVYRRMGETEKARQESELYRQISEKKNQQVERQRHELQQFVYTLREQQPASQNAPAPQ